MRLVFGLLACLAVSTVFAAPAAPTQKIDLFDQQRTRHVPVELHFPANAAACTQARPCPVVVLSPGHGMHASEYSFITAQLTTMGYLVAEVEHELPGDPDLDPEADRRAQLAVMSRAGADNLRFVLGELARSQPRYDWGRVVLVGHSLGGDSSALFASEDGARVAALVTLDSRRRPMPRDSRVKVLTLRASDTTADPGVLPDDAERARYGMCVTGIAGARHNDMQDAGSAALKERIGHAIEAFLAPAGQPRFGCVGDMRL